MIVLNSMSAKSQVPYFYLFFLFEALIRFGIFLEPVLYSRKLEMLI